MPNVSVATRAQGAKLATVVKAIADVLPFTARVDRDRADATAHLPRDRSLPVGNGRLGPVVAG